MTTCVMTLLAVVTVFVVLGNVMSQDCSYPPCFKVPDSVTYYYPNWNNCNTYWRCFNKVASLQSCPFGQVFDFYSLACKTRPTQSTFATNAVFSCEVLLNGIGSLSQL